MRVRARSSCSRRDFYRSAPLAALVLACAFPLSAQTYEIFRQFEGTGATDPRGALIQDPDNSFYGTSFTGGSGDCHGGSFPGCGTIFRLAPDGSVTILHEFTPEEGRPDSLPPPAGERREPVWHDRPGGRVRPRPCGTVYRLDANEQFTPLHTFQGDDGNGPCSALIEPAEGDLWGTTCAGGGTPARGAPSGAAPFSAHALQRRPGHHARAR